MVEMYVLGLTLEEETKAPIITLHSKNTGINLQIIVSPLEGMNLSMALQQLGARKALTHELALKLVEVFDGKLLAVEIYQPGQNVFNADLLLESSEGETLRIDARPADAIILAMSAKCPILVSKELLDKQGIRDFKNTEMATQVKNFDTEKSKMSNLSEEPKTPTITVSILKKDANGVEKIVDTIKTELRQVSSNANNLDNIEDRKKWLEKVQEQALISKVVETVNAETKGTEDEKRWQEMLSKEPLSKYKM
ncbi:bifunctional nuclease family protein [Desulfovibrio litoralis]|uniref:Bifunctional DNase/RNase n=1 Tax=Desulfovibrio litoralis DSM 11393 TaxID=1121455 RepID=A0A1M7SB29_9BACT|nr:bifunctional nuclease family protein [Desulfovibrio litoralis]SHN55726.1 Bifunctional DNase/RNase [Desulfovibrio litoralis DSM 11393]